MWVTVILFAIVAILVAGSIWESRRRRGRLAWHTSTSGDAGSIGHNPGSVYGHGSHGGYGDAGSGSFGDCGSSSGGGGGDGGSSC